MTPVAGHDLPELRALKANPAIFAVMLGGVRDKAQTSDDLARDVRSWGQYGFGVWAVREAGRMVGIAGLDNRPDGRGIALRFAMLPDAQGRGLAREAASAALRFGHDRVFLPRIVAAARETNFGSRIILGAIGMHVAETFEQHGTRMLLYESLSLPDRMLDV